MKLKVFEKRLRERPTLRKYNEDIYIVQDSESKMGFKVVQKSNGMILAKDVWHFGRQMTLGFYYGNSRQRSINKEGPKVKLIGGKR